jgi:hypothetical protein
MGETEATHSISKRNIARYEAAVRKLRSVLEDIRAECPTAEIYVEDAGNVYLLTGPSHDSSLAANARMERIVTCVIVPHMGGGGW